MKNIVLVFILFLSVCWPRFSQCSQIDRIKLGDSPWPPYTVGEVGRPPSGGLGVELVREIYRRLGIEITIELYPWKRVLKMVEEGMIDGPTLLMKNPDRERYLAYTIPVFYRREILFYSKDHLRDFTWETYADLSKFTIGLINGYTYGDDFLQAINELGLKIEYAGSGEVNFQKLMAGRIELVLEDPMVAKALIRKNQEWTRCISFAHKPVTIYPYHLALSKKSRAVSLIPRLDLIIKEMNADGSLEKILGSIP